MTQRESFVDSMQRVLPAGFIPVQDDADLPMDGTAQGIALHADAQTLLITNRGVTTEAIRITFGTSQTAAETALGIAGGLAVTGLYIPAMADGGPSHLLLGVPPAATHYALGNAVNGDTQVVSVTQGL